MVEEGNELTRRTGWRNELFKWGFAISWYVYMKKCGKYAECIWVLE